MKILGTQAETTEASFTNRIQETEERISGIDNNIVEMETPAQKKKSYS